MAWVVGVRKDLHAEAARRGVARDDVQVDMPVLVLEERIVDVIRAEGGRQRACGAGQLPLQLGPLGGGHVGHRLLVAPQHQEAFTQQVLVVVEDQSPVGALREERAEIRRA